MKLQPARTAAFSAFLLVALSACWLQNPGPPPDAGDAPALTTGSPHEVPTKVLPTRPLQCDLQAKPTYHADERVEMIFRLTNQGEKPLWVLRWNTPLEGLLGDCFEITHDGEVVFYQGRMVKRARPEASEYLLIPPGESREGRVDLRAAYQVEKPGRYELRFDSLLYDVVDDETLLPRKLEDHEPFDPRCPDVVFEVR